jgi:monofunctional biosynthetic peptidoglycan transglycosylase
VRKGLEGYYTILLELLLSKDRILEIYLNIAQFGPEVYGVPAAAKKYFGRPASRLTVSQAARLASVLPAPQSWSPLKTTEYMRTRRKQIIKAMNYVQMTPPAKEKSGK